METLTARGMADTLKEYKAIPGMELITSQLSVQCIIKNNLVLPP
jgi:hypothetical protein